MNLISVDLKDFIDNARAYQGSPYAAERLYKQTIERRDIWDMLSKIDEQKTRNVILKFLNAWKCRLSYDCASDLAKILRETSELLATFRKCSLQDATLDFLVIDDKIQEVFRKIANVSAGRRTVGATATSKILHMVNPNFFVMSDENIRYGYGCCDSEVGYANFMWRMKLFGDALVKQYSAERKIPQESAFKSLVFECKSGAPTFPKLLDEYNWMKYHS